MGKLTERINCEDNTTIEENLLTPYNHINIMDESWDLTETALIMLLITVALNNFLSKVFVLNFSTDGLNITVFLALLFLLPVLFYLLISPAKIPNYIIEFTMGLTAVLFNTLSLLPLAIVSILSSGIALSSLLVLLILHSNQTGTEVSNAVTLYISFYITLAILLVGLTIYATSIGRIVFLAVNLIFLILASFRLYENKQAGESSKVIFDHTSYINYFLLFGVIIYLNYIILNPFIFFSWTSDNNTRQIFLNIIGYETVNQNIIAATYGIGGIIAGLISLSIRDTVDLPFWIDPVLFLLAAIDLIFTQLWPFGTYFLSIFSIIGIISHLKPVDARKITGYNLFGIQLLLLILMFLQIISGHWVFLPTIIHPIIHGMAGVYIFVLGVLISVLALVNGGLLNE